MDVFLNTPLYSLQGSTDAAWMRDLIQQLPSLPTYTEGNDGSHDFAGQCQFVCLLTGVVVYIVVYTVVDVPFVFMLRILIYIFLIGHY